MGSIEKVAFKSFNTFVIKIIHFELFYQNTDILNFLLINELIGLNFNTTLKFRLPETFLRYQPRPQPVLSCL